MQLEVFSFCFTSSLFWIINLNLIPKIVLSNSGLRVTDDDVWIQNKPAIQRKRFSEVIERKENGGESTPRCNYTILLLQWKNRETTNPIRKRKNRTFTINAAIPAIIQKPRRPATMAITRKNRTRPNMVPTSFDDSLHLLFQRERDTMGISPTKFNNSKSG